MFWSTVLKARSATPRRAIRAASPTVFLRHMEFSHNARSLAPSGVAVRHITTADTHRARADVLNTVIGQRLRIPDVKTQFEGWPWLSNPHKDSVTEGVNEILRKYTVTPKVMHRLTKNQLDVLVAGWFPLASRERLAELAQFVCWMFIVDDEIDGMAKASMEEFRHIWDEILRVISESCALHGHDAGAEFRKSEFQSAETFRPFGVRLMERYTQEQRQRFWNELKITADAYIKLHEFTKLDRIPDYDAYSIGRYGSSCMAQNLAMFEYANESNIPEEIMESLELKTLWKETTDLTWIWNDIVSFKKEIADGFMDNMVLIASKPSYDLQAGLDHCIERMADAVSRTNKAVATLETKYLRSDRGHGTAGSADSDRIAQDLEKFITCCKALVTGTFAWGQSTPRYGSLDKDRAADGSISFTTGDKIAI